LVLVAAGALALIGGSVGATLYFTGFFSPKPVEAAKQEGEGHGGEHAEGEGDDSGEEAGPEAGGGEAKDSAEVPEAEKFAATYKPIERDFTMNVPNSKKFVQFKVAYKTFYGDKIVERVVKHQIAIEAAMLTAAAQFSEEELVSLEGRTRVAGALRDAMNDVLIRNEDFGGIEEVMFTHFVFQ
jgi:flagellar FliL protein